MAYKSEVGTLLEQTYEENLKLYQINKNLDEENKTLKRKLKLVNNQAHDVQINLQKITKDFYSLDKRNKKLEFENNTLKRINR